MDIEYAITVFIPILYSPKGSYIEKSLSSSESKGLSQAHNTSPNQTYYIWKGQSTGTMMMEPNKTKFIEIFSCSPIPNRGKLLNLSTEVRLEGTLIKLEG